MTAPVTLARSSDAGHISNNSMHGSATKMYLLHNRGLGSATPRTPLALIRKTRRTEKSCSCRSCPDRRTLDLAPLHLAVDAHPQVDGVEFLSPGGFEVAEQLHAVRCVTTEDHIH